MTIMITGGTGFLGSYLARHLVQEKGIRGRELILFDRYPNKERLAEVANDVTVVAGDISEPSEIAAAITNYRWTASTIWRRSWATRRPRRWCRI